jgi:hypothetical protein
VTVVEAIQPNTGRVFGLTEVNLTSSKLLIAIVDDNGQEVLIHRYAWPGVVKAVEELFTESERQAHEHNLATGAYDDD